MRARSAAIISRRLSGRWSTQLPMNSETMLGSHTAAVSSPTSVGVAFEQRDRDQRQRKLGDAVAEFRDRLGRPEGQELPVAPQASEACAQPHRVLCSMPWKAR